MKYIASSKSFTITQKELEMASCSLIHALKHIRQLAGLPLDRYHHEGPLENADFAQKAILDAAKEVGIDLGAEWGDQLDLRTIS